MDIWREILLYNLAFVGLWHLIGISPIKDWCKKNSEKES